MSSRYFKASDPKEIKTKLALTKHEPHEVLDGCNHFITLLSPKRRFCCWSLFIFSFANLAFATHFDYPLSLSFVCFDYKPD